MKRGTYDHPKLIELAAELGVRRYAAAGILEGMWAWTARYTPQGNIGKYSDKAIAVAVDWDGDPASMVLALIKTRWLDTDPEHRLIVHDWKDHCDQTTDRFLKANKLPYLLANASTSLANSSLPVSVSVPVSVPVSVKEALSPSATTKPDSKPALPPGFVRFWDAYPKRCPRRNGKPKALALWKRNGLEAQAEAVLTALAAWDANHPDWQKNGGDFICAPCVWLNKKPWLDDLPAPPTLEVDRAFDEMCDRVFGPGDGNGQDAGERGVREAQEAVPGLEDQRRAGPGVAFQTPDDLPVHRE